MALEAYAPGSTTHGLPALREHRSKTERYIRTSFRRLPIISLAGLMLATLMFWLYAVCTRPSSLWSVESLALASASFAEHCPVERIKPLSAILRMHALTVYLRQSLVREKLGTDHIVQPQGSSNAGNDQCHITAKHFKKGQHRTFPTPQVAVVGAGPAGMLAATLLAEAGVRVMLIEAGVDKDPKQFADDSANAMYENMWAELISLGSVNYPVLRGKLMGGTAAINSGIMVDLTDDVINEWMDKYGFPKDEAIRTRLRKIIRQLRRDMNVATVNSRQEGDAEQLIKIGGKAHSLTYHMDRNAPTCTTSGKCLEGCRGGHKRHPREVWLNRFIAAGGILLGTATATKLTHRNGEVTAVKGYVGQKRDNKRFTVTADEFVLAAGAVGTPELMLRSGLKRFLPRLGRDGRAHPGAAVVGEYERELTNAGPTQGTATTDLRHSGKVKFETLRVPLHVSGARPNIGGESLMDYLASWKRKANWVVVNWARQSEVRIKIGLFGALQYHFRYHPDDLDNLVNGVKLLVKQHFAAGAVKVYPYVLGLPTYLTRDDIDRIDDLFDAIPRTEPWRLPYGVLTHLFGGACWGEDAKSSVCDWDGRVHGCENLYVFCAAGFPTNIGVNPQLSISTMAWWMTEKLIARKFVQ